VEASRGKVTNQVRENKRNEEKNLWLGTVFTAWMLRGVVGVVVVVVIKQDLG